MCIGTDIIVGSFCLRANLDGDLCEIFVGVLGSIFFEYTVVGNDTYSLYTKLGVGMLKT